jgi:hypothetical protein
VPDLLGHSQLMLDGEIKNTDFRSPAWRFLKEFMQRPTEVEQPD